MPGRRPSPRTASRAGGRSTRRRRTASRTDRESARPARPAPTAGQSDPAVDQQEQRRDLGGTAAAGDPLRDDPRPGDETEGPQRPAQPGAAAGGPAPIDVGSIRPNVAHEHEDERQRHGRRGTGEVDRERQSARVCRVEGVRRHAGRYGQRDEGAGGDAAGELPGASHQVTYGRGRLRLSRKPAPTATIASAAMIGSRISPVPDVGVVGVGLALGLAIGDALGGADEGATDGELTGVLASRRRRRRLWTCAHRP